MKAIYNNGEKEKEKEKESIFQIYEDMAIPDDQKRLTLGLPMTHSHMGRLLFLSELYKKILNVHGVIMEFGVHWGNNIAWLASLHTLFEPLNKTRKIIGFDTFSGFPHVHDQDGKGTGIFKGNFLVNENHLIQLKSIIKAKDDFCAIKRTNEIEFVVGDICQTANEYMNSHPETMVALAYFDIDLYEPTKIALNAIITRMVKGSILAFDEPGDPNWPGETLAIEEVLKIHNLRMKRSPYSGNVSYVIIE